MDLWKKWDLVEDAQYDPRGTSYYNRSQYYRLNDNQREGRNWIKASRWGRDSTTVNLPGNGNIGTARFRKVGRLVPFNHEKTMPPRQGDAILIIGGDIGIVIRTTPEGVLVKRQSLYSHGRDQVIGRHEIKRIARLAMNSAVLFEL